MSELPGYRPIWPETVIFWGAGATRALNIHTTNELGQAIYFLAENGKSLGARVHDGFSRDPAAANVVDLLIILGDDDEGRADFPSPVQAQALARQFPLLSEDERKRRGRELQSTYDWGTLRQVVHVCPGHDARSFKLQDLFNLLDMHIQSHHGFYVYSGNGTGQRFVPSEALVVARNALVMLIGLLHFFDYQRTLRQNNDILQQYISFAETLTRLMQEEGLRFYRQGHRIDGRQFYLFSYALISMNWDPIMLWLIFNAHKKANRSVQTPSIDDPAVPLKMYYDLSCFMGVRPVDSPDINVWYPFNESVVQRTNNAGHIVSRRVRLGKIYFPHGCSNWRECPSCGKLTMYLGNEWQYASPSLFPPPLLPGFTDDWRKSGSHEESEAHKAGMADVVQCVHCGTLTEFKHTPLVMQSNFKGGYAPFLEEIQRDMRVALENAEHIVLMGYTIPADDVIYRSLLSARQKRGRAPYCSVIVGKQQGAPDCWLQGAELKEYLKKTGSQSAFTQAVQSAQEIFAENQVRGYACGIPRVFIDDRDEVSYDKVKQLLYPRERFSENRVDRS